MKKLYKITFVDSFGEAQRSSYTDSLDLKIKEGGSNLGYA